MAETEFKCLLFASLLVLIWAQELSSNQIGGGGFLPMRKDQRAVPRYYICGAEMNQFKYIKQWPQTCWADCNRGWYRWRYRCRWRTVCRKNPNTHEWTRTNGIRFKFCHIQKWQDQYVSEEHGNWEWKGMRMCPANQMVYGYSIKLTNRDGLAGLILHCRNPFNIYQTSQVMVLDGEGSWVARDYGGIASGFKIKRNEGYINGIAFQFSPMPQINSFDIKYSIPTNLNASPQIIDSIIVTNHGKETTKKIIEFSKSREFQRSWQNEKGEMNGFTLSRMFTQQFSIRASISVAGLFTKSSVTTDYRQKLQTTTTTTRESMQKFSFGTVDKMIVGQTIKDEVPVGACTKKIIRLIVFSAYVDVPYVASIGFTNGITTEVDQIKGYFRGTLTTNSQTIIEDVKIC